MTRQPMTTQRHAFGERALNVLWSVARLLPQQLQ